MSVTFKTTKVKCVSLKESAQYFGSNTGSLISLEIGKEYEVFAIEQHSWYTKIYLKDIDGSFNSVLFEAVE